VVSLATSNDPDAVGAVFAGAEAAHRAALEAGAALGAAGAEHALGDEDEDEDEGAGRGGGREDGHDGPEGRRGVSSEAGGAGGAFDDADDGGVGSGAGGALSRDALLERLEAAEMRHKDLYDQNVELQRRLALYFSVRQSGEDDVRGGSRGSGRAGDGGGGGGGAGDSLGGDKERRYTDMLAMLRKKKMAADTASHKADEEALSLQARLETRQTQASELGEGLRQWKRTTARAAVHSKTGRALPRGVIVKYEEEERSRDIEIERVRVRNIQMHMRLRRLEERLRDKEQLADGLALIDFEQLKIENSTLNEKIEDRNEELHKLRKKTTTTVQVLTHVKEKLQFVANEAAELKASMTQIEEQVSGLRDGLAHTKHAREVLREANEQKRTEQGFAHVDLLAKDFERRKRDMKRMRDQLAEMRERHAYLTAVIRRCETQATTLTASLAGGAGLLAGGAAAPAAAAGSASGARVGTVGRPR
jgi:hypothetical protein